MSLSVTQIRPDVIMRPIENRPDPNTLGIARGTIFISTTRFYQAVLVARPDNPKFSYWDADLNTNDVQLLTISNAMFDDGALLVQANDGSWGPAPQGGAAQGSSFGGATASNQAIAVVSPGAGRVPFYTGPPVNEGDPLTPDALGNPTLAGPGDVVAAVAKSSSPGSGIFQLWYCLTF